MSARPASTPATASDHAGAARFHHHTARAIATVDGTDAASSPLKVMPSRCGATPMTAYPNAAAIPTRRFTSSVPSAPSATVMTAPPTTTPSRTVQPESSSQSRAR